MANESNLIPFSQRTESEQREISRKGGKASGRSRREKRTLKDLLQIRLSVPVTNRTTGETVSTKEVITIRLLEKCMKGDLKAIELMAKLIGEAKEQREVTGKDGAPLIPSNKMTEKEMIEDIRRIYKIVSDDEEQDRKNMGAC